MNAVNPIPDAVRITMETFEKLIHSDERRRDELLDEIAALQLRERVIGATQDAQWIRERFIEPRLSELRAVEGRLQMIRQKLTQVQERWAQSERAALVPVWLEGGSSGILALTA